MTCDLSNHNDALNRLIRVDTPQGSINYVYNGDNQRVTKMTATSTTHYVFDGLSVVAELDATGTVTKAYNPGISYTDDQGSTFYYMYDGLGSVVNLVDEDQNIVQAYSYDAWGKAEGLEKDFNSSRFVGGYAVSADDDTGLQYMWNRWYETNTGRFVSRDILGFAAGINRYAYADDNPNRFIDPWGLCSQDPQYDDLKSKTEELIREKIVEGIVMYNRDRIIKNLPRFIKYNVIPKSLRASVKVPTLRVITSTAFTVHQIVDVPLTTIQVYFLAGNLNEGEQEYLDHLWAEYERKRANPESCPGKRP